jgi:hypothetical protein
MDSNKFPSWCMEPESCNTLRYILDNNGTISPTSCKFCESNKYNHDFCLDQIIKNEIADYE